MEIYFSFKYLYWYIFSDVVFVLLVPFGRFKITATGFLSTVGRLVTHLVTIKTLPLVAWESSEFF